MSRLATITAHGLALKKRLAAEDDPQARAHIDANLRLLRLQYIDERDWENGMNRVRQLCSDDEFQAGLEPIECEAL